MVCIFQQFFIPSSPFALFTFTSFTFFGDILRIVTLNNWDLASTLVFTELNLMRKIYFKKVVFF